MRLLSRLILRLLGWKVICPQPLQQKSVMCIAPHTSNWDFIYGLLLYSAAGGRGLRFFMKKEWFFFPLNIFFRLIGGIPVDRQRKSALTDKVSEEMKEHRYYNIAIAPEGTRKAVAEWKKGFYYIALKAGVPIQLAYLDYARREGGITKALQPTGNEESDLAQIYDYYQGVTPRFPNRFRDMTDD